MSTTWVFVGPTLPSAEVGALLPHARVEPPVRHGDLLRLDPRPGDTVLVVDGLFLQTASVRHRELLHLLDAGVTVAGSSSMGALRAAELHRYGMRGYGEVFRLYRDGIVDGDDEVAIVHSTGEDGHRPLSDPAVAIRVALRAAVAAGVLDTEVAAATLADVLATPFPARSFRAAEHGMPAASAARFRAWRAARDTDVKAADARLMLAAAAAGDPRLRPAGPGDEPVRNVRTWLFDMWQHHYRGGPDPDGGWVTDADAGVALRLFHPGYPQLHRRHVLAGVAGLDPEHPDLIARALAVAAERGLRTGGPGGWITERDVGAPADELLVRLLVRAFGCARRWSPTAADLPVPLRSEAALAAGRGVVAAARRTGTGDPADVDGAGVELALSRAWGCGADDLERHGWDRGIPDLATLRDLAAPFAAYAAAEAPGGGGFPGADTISAASAAMAVTW